VIEYLQKGGLLMWPILACSIISIAVFGERLFYLHRATIHVGEILKGLANLIKRRNFAEALHESAGTPGPVSRDRSCAKSSRKPPNWRCLNWSDFSGYLRRLPTWHHCLVCSAPSRE